MTELGRAGFSPKQIEEMTGAVMNLAKPLGRMQPLALGSCQPPSVNSAWKQLMAVRVQID